MIRKIFDILLYLFFAFLFIVGIARIINMFSEEDPIIFGLKIKHANPINYLPEANSTILKNNYNSVALFSTKTDTTTLERVFKTAGIPYFKCSHLKDANASHILFLDFDINKKTQLSDKDVNFLYDFVANGGIVIGNEIFNVKYGKLKELFGYKDFKSTKEHRKLLLFDNPYMKYLNEPEETTYTLSTLNDAPFTNSIINTTSKSLAIYEDHTPAITYNNYKNGKAILLGISLFDLRYRNLFGKDFNANKKYCNDFEPLSDFIVMFLKGIYEYELKNSITLATAPRDYRVTIILTHDVDYTDSMENIDKFIETENNLGVKSTFFIFTKYITDDKDKAYFNQGTLKHILNAQNQKFEIGSHTVLHSM